MSRASTPLPDGWEWAPLRSLGSWFGGSTPSKGEPGYWSNGGVPWLSPKDMSTPELESTIDGVSSRALEETNLRLLPAMSIAVVIRSGILERRVPISLVPFETTINQDMKAVVPHPGVSPRWLWYAMLSLEQRILTDCRKAGTTVASIEPEKLLSLQVAVPPSPEQRRIAARLEAHFDRVGHADRLVGTLRRRNSALRRSLLAAAVRGDLAGNESDPVANSAIAHLEERSRTPMEQGDWELPSGWIWARTGDLFDVAVGRTPARHEPTLWDGDIPWVSSGEVAFNRIRATRETISGKGLGNVKRLHPAGTVMLAMIGEGKTRGQAAILDVAAAHNQNCASIEVAASPVLPEWVYYCLAERYERSRLLGSGNNQPAMNKKLVESIQLPVPPDLVQAVLVGRLEEAMRGLAQVEAGLDAQAKRLVGLRQSLLRAAQRGDVADRSNEDEPASVLLRRLATEAGVGVGARPPAGSNMRASARSRSILTKETSK